MSRYELKSFEEDVSIHVGWDQKQSMFYLEAQDHGFPGEYVLEADLDNLVIQAERYGEVPENVREELLREESRHFANNVDFNRSAESEIDWEEDLDLMDDFDFSRDDGWER